MAQAVAGSALAQTILDCNAEIKRRRGSAKPHSLFAMAAVAPATTKLLVGFPSVSKAVTPARSFFNHQRSNMRLSYTTHQASDPLFSLERRERALDDLFSLFSSFLSLSVALSDYLG